MEEINPNNPKIKRLLKPPDSATRCPAYQLFQLFQYLLNGPVELGIFSI